MKSSKENIKEFVSFNLCSNYDLDPFNENSFNKDINSEKEISFDLSESKIEKNNVPDYESFMERDEDDSFEIFSNNLGINSEINSGNRLGSLTENNGEEEKEESNKKKIVKFTTTKILTKKRGRIPKPKPKKIVKEHTKDDNDNILKKIRVHFVSFLITLANDAIKATSTGIEYKNFFRPILHDVKCKIKNYDILKLKYQNIFTDYTISPNKGIKKKNEKYVSNKEETNKKNYEHICKEFPSLKNFFEQKMIDIFKNYYCKNKNDINNMFDFEGVKIKLSSKTKTFYDLLEKEENKNSKNKFIKIINRYFGCNL
jgi:hypothetical protein